MQNIETKYKNDENQVTIPRSILTSGWWLIDDEHHKQYQSKFSAKDQSTNLPIPKGAI